MWWDSSTCLLLGLSLKPAGGKKKKKRNLQEGWWEGWSGCLQASGCHVENAVDFNEISYLALGWEEMCLSGPWAYDLSVLPKFIKIIWGHRTSDRVVVITWYRFWSVFFLLEEHCKLRMGFLFALLAFPPFFPSSPTISTHWLLPTYDLNFPHIST